MHAEWKQNNEREQHDAIKMGWNGMKNVTIFLSATAIIYCAVSILVLAYLVIDVRIHSQLEELDEAVNTGTTLIAELQKSPLILHLN